MTHIRCIALTALTINGKEYSTPPEDSEGRISSYVFSMPCMAAAALAKRSRLLPAYQGDAEKLERETGYRIGSYTGEPIPKTKAAKATKKAAKKPAAKKPTKRKPAAKKTEKS